MKGKTCFKKSRGITLIELLVVMVVLAIGMSATFAGYRNFDRTQKVRQAALTLKNNLRLAQTKAISVDHPLSCITLNSIDVRINTSPPKYTLYNNCNGLQKISEISLPSTITFAGNDISFSPLTGTINSNQTYTLSSGTVIYNVTVFTNGVIECQSSSGKPCY